MMQCFGIMISLYRHKSQMLRPVDPQARERWKARVKAGRAIAFVIIVLSIAAFTAYTAVALWATIYA